MSARSNVAASVTARLLSLARERGNDDQTLLTSYRLERFLYRLGASDWRNRFVLKGAMLLRLWSDRPYRATRDLDLLRRGDGADDAIRAYWDNPSRPAQVRAFARRAGLAVAEGFADQCATMLAVFLTPVLDDLRSGHSGAGAWPPGGPWR